MAKTEEEIALQEFISKMTAGDDSAAVFLLDKEFSEDADYSGATLVVFLADNSNLVKVLFQAIHFGCREIFGRLRDVLLAQARESGFPPEICAEAIYYVKLDDYSNLGDEALAEHIASGSAPDLWPIPDQPLYFGIPSRAWSEGIGFDPTVIYFDEAQSSTKLEGKTLEIVLPISVLVTGREGLDSESERLTPEEFGDRSRHSEHLTLVCNVSM
jgi:hypothetical protein